MASVTLLPENAKKVDVRMLYTCIRSSEGEHAHTSHSSDIFERKYIEENNLVRSHANISNFLNVYTPILL